jgi:hypothetical protein
MAASGRPADIATSELVHGVRPAVNDRKVNATLAQAKT